MTITEPTTAGVQRVPTKRTVLMCRPTHFTVSHLIDPIAGLPDMVYAANGGFVIDNIAYGASFTYPERQPEGPAYMDWFRDNGYDVRVPENINEGEGDFLLVG